MSAAIAYQDTRSWAETPGASNEARQVERGHADAFYAVKATIAGVSAICSELMSLAAERVEGVSGSTLAKALEFAATLPSDVELPEVSIDPDGELAFDWVREGGLLSVSVGETGRVTYAAEFGGHPVSDTVQLVGWVSSSLGEVLKEFRHSPA